MRFLPCCVVVGALASTQCGSPNPTGDVAANDAADVTNTVDAPGIDAPGVDVPGVDAPVSDTPMGVDRPTDTGSTLFPVGTICNDTGTPRTPPATLQHVIVIMMENKPFASVNGNAQAPYFSGLAAQCGVGTHFMDNVFHSDLVSEPHYLALTSGSNCNTGLESATANAGSTGCITDDADVSAHTLHTTSIFSQVASWRAYQESMPNACDGTSSGRYGAKHNPPPYFTSVTNCTANDISLPHANCPTTLNTMCGAPDDAFTQDLMNDTLPALSFVTPDLTNDMHDGTVAQGDNYLHTYLPLIFSSMAYRRGQVAVYVMWDESSSPGTPQPNLFISPYIAPTSSATTMNLFSVLRTIEDQLGIATHLGCAGGTPPGGIGTCPTGSTTDLRTVFNF